MVTACPMGADGCTNDVPTGFLYGDAVEKEIVEIAASKGVRVIAVGERLRDWTVRDDRNRLFVPPAV
jgi:hypothetical protein